MAEQVFISWSGGKDSCLAGYLAMKSGLQVCYLANTISEDGQRSRSHGLPAEVLIQQSQALGIPLIQQKTGRTDYEVNFKSMLRRLRQEGITGGVFGDIDFEPHFEWVERVCRETDIRPHFPLRGMKQEQIMKDFVALGFEAVVVATRADVLGEEWLGRTLDSNFIKELKELSQTKELTLCGEAGEYHTLVIDGPIFNQRLEILSANKVLREANWFLDIKRVKLTAKPKVQS